MKKQNYKGIIIGVAATVGVILAILFFMKGSIYQMIVKYEDAGGRKSYEVKDQALAKYINENLPNDETLDATIDIEMIADLSLEMTDKALTYMADTKANDPVKTYADGYANYTGYAAFAAAVGDYLIKRFELKDWEVKPRKAKLYRFGTNKSKKALDGWYKDHDFVVFKNKKTKEELYIDPTAYSEYGTKRVDKYQK